MASNRLSPKIQLLRRLDIDDLIVLTHLGRGESYSAICKVLFTTPGMVCYRLKKCRDAWGEEFSIKSNGYKRVFSPLAKKVCDTAPMILEALS